jgi:endonuclease/exonuclease/phosphatase family metal-dependent hydrolase
MKTHRLPQHLRSLRNDGINNMQPLTRQSLNRVLSQLQIGYYACLTLLAGVLTSDAAGKPGGGGTAVSNIKVMTLNCYVNASGGLTPLKNAITGAGADVVGLQEADGYTIKALADSLNWNWIQTGGAGQYGIISRYPVIRRIGETVEAYGGVGATIELSANQRVHLFSTHLNWTPYGPYQLQDGLTANQIINSENSVRMPGLNELLNLASPFVATAEPSFLVGDFNAPSDLDYATLAWPESIACRNAGLADSYRDLHAGNRTFPGPFAFDEPGITWTPKGLTSEPRGVYDRIDFVYYSTGDGAVPTVSDTVTTSGSDHRGVVSTFTVTMPAQLVKAAAAIPANGFNGASIRPLLTWVPGTNAASHNVYFGTTNPGSLQGNQTDSKFYPGRLAPSTTYYWRIDEVKTGGTVTGDVWSFTTGNYSWEEPGKTSYTKNENIIVNFGNAKNKTDWIGIYAVGSAYGPGGAASIDWYYLNGSKTAPGSTVSNGTITFPKQPAGSYLLRFFANDGFTLIDEVPFTITSR